MSEGGGGGCARGSAGVHQTLSSIGATCLLLVIGASFCDSPRRDSLWRFTLAFSSQSDVFVFVFVFVLFLLLLLFFLFFVLGGGGVNICSRGCQVSSDCRWKSY